MIPTLRKLRVQMRPNRASTFMDAIWLAVFIACVYTLAAQMSLALLTPDGVAVFWPAAGIAAGMLITLGRNARWGVALGTIAATVVANLLGDRNIFSAVAFALCNAGEALLVAALIERYFGWPFTLDRLRNVLGFLVIAIVSTALSGIGGTLGFILFHHTAASIFLTWQNWFASDALGIITLAPLVIGLGLLPHDLPPRSETVEGLLALGTLIVISMIVVALPQEPSLTAVPIALLFPVLLWNTARCRPIFAAAAVFIVTLAIVVTTTIGVGHFGGPALPVAERVLAARAGILAVALCAYVLAALFAERRRHEAALAESEARLQEALTAGAVTTFVWDAGTNVSQRSANAAQVLGFDPHQSLSANGFLSRVHPDDRERFKAVVRGATPISPLYTASFRFKRSDGREVWLEETAKAEFDQVGRPVRLKGLTVDASARKASEDHQSLLIARLDERVKKLLARISVLTKDMRRSSDSVDVYVQALGERIQSMAAAYALLSRDQWQGVDLADLVRSQLAPNATDANAVIEGPSVILPVETAEALAMVLHELATNAARYGALSTPHGRVEVSWTRATGKDAGSLSIAWREIGGPAVTASPDDRYGVSIIRGLIPNDLQGSVELAFDPSGVRCNMQIPL